MATHEGPELDRASVVLPAAVWAEVEGTFTNYQRRVQRVRVAVPAPGDATPRWELAAGLLERLGRPLGGDERARAVRACSPRRRRTTAGSTTARSARPARPLPLAEAGRPRGSAQEVRA